METPTRTQSLKVIKTKSGRLRIPCSFPMRHIPLSPIPVGCLHQNPRTGSTTEVICEAIKSHSGYRHLRVDWVGESATESITLCGIENEDSGTEQTLCPNCAQVRDALNVCRLGPESLRELFDTLRVIDPSEVKAKMEALRGLGVQMDIQDWSQLN